MDRKEYVTPLSEEEKKKSNIEAMAKDAVNLHEKIDKTSAEELNSVADKKVIKKAAKIVGIKKPSEKDVRQVQKDFQDPNKRRKGTEDIENDKGSISSQLTGALVHFTPHLIGMAIGGAIGGGAGAAKGFELAGKAAEGLKGESELDKARAAKLRAETDVINAPVQSLGDPKDLRQRTVRLFKTNEAGESVPTDLHGWTVKDAEVLKSKQVFTENIKESVNQLRELGAQYSIADASKENMAIKAKMGMIRKAMAGQLREAILGPGTVNESEREILMSLIGDPSKVFQYDTTYEAQLDELNRTLDNSMENTVLTRTMEGYDLKMKKVSERRKRIEELRNKR
jgi:hypothetical protein